MVARYCMRRYVYKCYHTSDLSLEKNPVFWKAVIGLELELGLGPVTAMCAALLLSRETHNEPFIIPNYCRYTRIKSEANFQTTSAIYLQ